jgi:flagellin-like protein
MKGVSPLLATVFLVAFVIAVAFIVASTFSSLAESQAAAAAEKGKCTGGAISIIGTKCSNNTLSVYIQNVGDIDLKNFTIYAEINKYVLLNSSPVNGSKILKPGKIVDLYAYINTTKYTGEISKLRVSAGNCPVYQELRNYTATIATCE